MANISSFWTSYALDRLRGETERRRRTNVTTWCGKFFRPDVEGKSHANLPVPAYGMLREIASAMAYMHHRGLIDGNLKPAKVILFHGNRSWPTCRVRGFECARVEDDDRSSGEGGFGTPCFRASEIASSHPRVLTTKQTDAWAFGMICYSVSKNGFEPYHQLKTPDEVRVGTQSFFSLSPG